MPHVSTHGRVYVAAGHHRQPRNGSTYIEPYPSDEAEVVTGTTFTSFAAPHLSYQINGQELEGTFLFWSAGDGTNGSTSTEPQLSQVVGDAALNLTAWYLPPGGTGPGGGSGYLLDAFSAATGNFIDDTFVDVTSDASLTAEANVVGDISTKLPETLQAHAGVASTAESFEHWIAVSVPDDKPLVAAGGTLDLAAGTSGVAIATYHKNQIQTPNLGGLSAKEAWIILYGIIQDGGGLEIHPGGGGPHPEGPWGPFIAEIARTAGVGVLASSLPGAAGAQIQLLAAREALRAAEVNVKAIQQAADKHR